MKNKMVQISAERYLGLLEAEDKLNALECCGVDNWCGYGEHCDLTEGEEKLLKEVEKSIVK